MSTKTFTSITEAVHESLYVRTCRRVTSEVTALIRLMKAQEAYEKIRLKHFEIQEFEDVEEQEEIQIIVPEKFEIEQEYFIDTTQTVELTTQEIEQVKVESVSTETSQVESEEEQLDITIIVDSPEIFEIDEPETTVTLEIEQVKEEQIIVIAEVPQTVQTVQIEEVKVQSVQKVKKYQKARVQKPKVNGLDLQQHIQEESNIRVSPKQKTQEEQELEQIQNQLIEEQYQVIFKQQNAQLKRQLKGAKLNEKQQAQYDAELRKIKERITKNVKGKTMVLGELKKMIQLEKFVKSQKNIRRFVVFRGENYTQTENILIKTSIDSCEDTKKIFKQEIITENFVEQVGQVIELIGEYQLKDITE